MGIWRVVRHASGRSDSPSPVLRRRRAPSNPPPRSPLKAKSVSSVNDGINTINRAELAGVLMVLQQGKMTLPLIVHPASPRFTEKT
eukprot:1160931-Pelagomonas_calceolata.AAC.2